MKRMVSILLALALGLCIPAHAAEEKTLATLEAQVKCLVNVDSEEYRRGYEDGLVQGRLDCAIGEYVELAGPEGEDYSAGYQKGYDESYYAIMPLRELGDGEIAQLVEPTLLVNGAVSDVPVVLENNRAYAAAADLNRIFGTSLTGDRVSVRDAATAAGWGVTWNSWNRQVILMDKAAYLKESGLDNVNRLLNASLARLKDGGTTVQDCTLSLTLAETGKSARATLRTETTREAERIQLKLSLSAAELFALLPEELLEDGDEAAELKAALDKLELTVLLNGRTGDLYLNIPVLHLLDETVPEDLWYHFAIPTDALSAAEDPDFASLLFDMLLTLMEDSAYPEDTAMAIDCLKGYFAAIFGPTALTEKDGTFTWKLDTKAANKAASDLAARISEAMGETAPAFDLFKTYEIDMVIRADGTGTAKVAMELNADTLSTLTDDEDTAGLLDFRISAESVTTARGGTQQLELAWNRIFTLKLDGTITEKAGGKVPEKPAGTIESMELPGPVELSELVPSMDELF